MREIQYDLNCVSRVGMLIRESIWRWCINYEKYLGYQYAIKIKYMDLDDALLGFEKVLSSWMKEEKKRKDRKALSQIHFHLSNQILQDVLKEKMVAALWLKL